MDFDRYLRNEAKNEAIRTPDGYDERISHVLKGLDGKKRYGKRRFTLLIAIVLLGCGTALAVNYALRMQGSDIAFFEGAQDQDFASQQEYWEGMSDTVDARVVNQKETPVQPVTGDLGVAISDSSGSAIELTIDNIAMDMNYLHVFYTVKTEDALEDISLRHGGSFSPTINGEEFAWFSTGGRGGEPYLADAHTIVGSATWGLLENIPEQFALTLRAQHLFGYDGLWEANFDIDLTEVFDEAKVVYPQKTIQVQRTLYEDLAEEYVIDDFNIVHDVVVERISLTDNGGMIILGEYPLEPIPMKPEVYEKRKEAEDRPIDDFAYEIIPYVDFFAYDQDGNSLPITSDSVNSGRGYTRNVLEFTADPSIESITLVPSVAVQEGVKEIIVSFDEIGKVYEIFPGASVQLVDVSYDTETEYGGEISTNNSVILRYIEKGVSGSYAKRRFLGADGEEVALAATMTSEEPYVDIATGITTDRIAVEFPEDAPGDIESFTGMIFEYTIQVEATENKTIFEFP